MYFWEKAMAPHSSTLAWKIPWTEEPGRLQSMRLHRVGHDWATWLSLFTFLHWRRKWQPTPVFLPGESQGRGSLVGCPSMGLHRVGHNWGDLAAAAAAMCISDFKKIKREILSSFSYIFLIVRLLFWVEYCIQQVFQRNFGLLNLFWEYWASFTYTKR